LWVTRRDRAHAFLWIGALVALTDAGYALLEFVLRRAGFLHLLPAVAGGSRGDRHSRRETSLAGILRWSLWSALWVLAKPQNAPIGLLLGFFTLRLGMWTRSKRARMAAVAGGCCHVRVRGVQCDHDAGLRTPGEYLRHGLLGHPRGFEDPEADLRALGLDPQLAKYAGTGAWSPGPTFRRSPLREC
jgi:hypothetical protein